MIRKLRRQALPGGLAALLMAWAGSVAAAHTYPLPEEGDVVGERYTVRAEEGRNLLEIARDHGIGYEEIRRANPDVSTWRPRPGEEIVIPRELILPPGPREGIVVNLAEMRLYYYPEEPVDGEQVVKTFPVSIGRMDWSTPLGETEVTGRIEDPAWFPPESIREAARERGQELPRKVSPGPHNPLGRHAILLDIPGYLIHGTNRPWGIGMQATHGCIRLHPDDIELLFEAVRPGMAVRIVDEPFKAGWKDGRLYLQAYPELVSAEKQPGHTERLQRAVEAVASALGERQHRIDRERLREAIERSEGRLVGISRDGERLTAARDD